MKTHYELLSVPSNASAERIKSAYRKKIKEIHPDTNPGETHTSKEMQELLYACQVLLDKEKRADYDHSLRIRGTRGPRRYRFHYRSFLLENLDSGYCCYRLVLYELLKGRRKSATRFYETFVPRYDIFQHLLREDAMDCLFLLAEAYEREKKPFEAFELFMKLLAYEQEKPYFKHFIVEILDRVKYLVVKALPKVLSPESAVRCIWQAMQCDYSEKEMHKMEETAQRINRGAKLHLQEETSV